MTNTCLNKRINNSFVLKLDFLLRGMHIHIYTRRVYIDKYCVQRITAFRNQIIVNTHNGMMQVGTSDIAVIDKKELFALGFFGRIGFSNKSPNIGYRGIFLHRNQFFVIIITKKVNNPLPVIGGF